MRVLRHRFTVPMVPEAAWELFTATGERRWAEHWSPEFPDGDDDRSPGTVFVTSHGSVETTWVVTACDPGERVAYARMSSDGTVGTVDVTCHAAESDTTQVTVTYRLTDVTADGQHHLSRFSDTFDHEIDGWRAAIVGSLT
jgi:hypothetical protein